MSDPETTKSDKIVETWSSSISSIELSSITHGWLGTKRKQKKGRSLIQRWRQYMVAHSGEELWYLLTLFASVDYLVAFIAIMIWARLLTLVFEAALTRPKEEFSKSVHPVSLSPGLTPGNASGNATPHRPIRKAEVISDDQKSVGRIALITGRIFHCSESAIRS